METSTNTIQTVQLTQNASPTVPARQPVTDAIIAQFTRMVEATYPNATAFPYHNWENHALEVVNTALQICDRMESIGVKPNRSVVEVAAKGHDSCYELDPKEYGLSTKEAVAAQYSERLLLELGADPVFAKRVGDAILDTEKSREPRSLEAQILRAADLAGVGEDFARYEAGSKLLHQEYQNSRKMCVEFPAFVKWQLSNVLADYLATTIYLTPQGTDELGRSTWHMAALTNFQKAYWSAQTIALFAPSSLPEVFYSRRELSGTELVIGVAPEKDLREELAFLRKWESKKDTPALVTPGSSRAASIPEASCDEAHIVFDPLNPNISEAVRILGDGGRLYLYLPEDSHGHQALVAEHITSLAHISQLQEVSTDGDWKTLVFQVSRADA